MEPSHASIYMSAAMLDEGRSRYVEWTRLTTRVREVLGATEDQLLKAWRPDKAGVVREHKDAPRLVTNVPTDVLVHHALRRRRPKTINGSPWCSLRSVTRRRISA